MLLSLSPGGGLGSSFASTFGQLTPSPTRIGFGDVPVGSTSAQAVALTNSGTADVTITGATVTGAGFSFSGLQLPITLAPGSTTSFKAVFDPNKVGTTEGKVSLTSNARNSTVTVLLAGAGTNLQLSASPGTVNFGNVTVGSSSVQTVTLTNTGSGSVTVSQANVTGTGFSVSGLAMPLTLAAGHSTSFNAVFSPTTTGNANGNISVLSNATNSPASVALSGSGVTLQLSASPASLSIAQGSQATSTITTTVSGFSSSISLSASGAPTGTTVSFNPSTITPPGSGNSTMTVTVGSSTAVGTYSITVSASGGGVQQSATVSLTVTAPPTFTLSASPTSLSVVQGNQGTSTITTTVSGGFNNPVSLSASGAPTGTTVSFNPVTIAAPGSGNSTMTVTVGSSTAVGTYSITVSASGGGVQQTAIVTLTVTNTTPTISYVQGNYSSPQMDQSTVSVTFTAAQVGGDLNVVVVGWFDITAVVNTVTDDSGNTYALAVGPTTINSSTWPISQSIYYAKNIATAAAGANSVTVTFSTAAAYPDIRILEYSGADPNNPVDITAASNGNSSMTGSGSGTTTNVTDLIFGANTVDTDTTGPGSGFTQRLLTSPDGDIAQDEMVEATGSYSATAPLGASGPWVMQMVAFRTPVTESGSFTLSASPASLSIDQGSQGTSTITTAINGGFNSSISLSASGAPTGTTVSFNPSSIAAPGAGTSTMTVAVEASTAAGTYSITVTGNGGGVQQSATVTLTVINSSGGGTQTLSLTPTSLSFGNTTIGDYGQLPVLVQNTGTGSVTISSATVTGTGYTLSNLSLPETLTAGQSTSFTVTFTPTGPGASNGTASLTSNAINSPSVESLSGTGIYSHSVNLTWIASNSPGVLGYNVYRGTISGGPYVEITSSPVSGTSYTDSTVSAGGTYYYVAAAVTQSGDSGYSDQATAQVPSP